MNRRKERENKKERAEIQEIQDIQVKDDIVTEIRDGQEVVVMNVDEFNKQFKKKRVSLKQKMMQDNDIDLKYIKYIQYKKRDDVFSFKMTNIPNMEQLKILIDIQESFN